MAVRCCAANRRGMLLQGWYDEQGLAVRIKGFVKTAAIVPFALFFSSAVCGAATYSLFTASRFDDPASLEPVVGGLKTFSQPVRLAAEQQTPQTAVQNDYQACLDNANIGHDAAWASECQRIGDKDRRDYANCTDNLNLSKTYCDAAYTIRDVSPSCRLPPGIATGLDAELERSRNRCLQQSKASPAPAAVNQSR